MNEQHLKRTCHLLMSSGVLQISEPLNACSIAARLSASESGLDKPLGAFRGQMSCIYLFQDVLSAGMSLYCGACRRSF